MSQTRNQELMEKLTLPKNARLRAQIPELIAKSERYADMMMEKYGPNQAQQTHKAYRVLALLNNICPSLHHYKLKPNFKPWDEDSWKEYNEMLSAHNYENSQSGAVYTDEAFDDMLEILNRLAAEDQKGAASDALSSAEPGHPVQNPD